MYNLIALRSFSWYKEVHRSWGVNTCYCLFDLWPMITIITGDGSIQKRLPQKEGVDMVTKLFLLVFPIIVFVIPLTALAQTEKPVLNLEQLIEEAVQNNPEILAAKKRWEVYKEKVPQAFALEDPMFSFGIVNVPYNFNFKQDDMTMKEFALSQKFPFPGKRPLMKQIAEKERRQRDGSQASLGKSAKSLHRYYQIS